MTARLGLALWGGMPLELLLDCIKLADRGGYTLCLLVEGFADPFSVLAAAARETHQIRLGTGVATVYTRSPVQTALAAATVDSVARGRFCLGLGVGHLENHLQRDDIEPDRPYPFTRRLQRLRETTELVRLIWTSALVGGTVTYEGEVFRVVGYRPRLPVIRDTIPIYFGALNRATVELAGELADGFVPILVPSARVTSLVDVARTRALVIGRDPAEVEAAFMIPCCVSDDRETARVAMRQDLAQHVFRLEFYQRHFRRMGFADMVDRILDRVAAGVPEESAFLVDDAALDAMTAYGDADEARAQIERFRDRGVTLPVIYPIHPEFGGLAPDDRAYAGVRHTIAALAPEPQ